MTTLIFSLKFQVKTSFYYYYKSKMPHFHFAIDQCKISMCYQMLTSEIIT